MDTRVVPPPQKRCASCVHFKLKSGEGDGAFGRCHRRAPAGQDFPMVMAADWCGEFAPKSPADCPVCAEREAFRTWFRNEILPLMQQAISNGSLRL